MILCSNLKCKYHNDKDKCTCKKVCLSLCGIHTEKGFEDYLKCNSFEEDEEYAKLREKIKPFLRDISEWSE